MQKERHVLVIFPHPDDETYGAGGTIASYTSKGIPVTYACLTLGEMGRNFGNPPIATRESLVNIRKKELKKACEILGIQDLRMLGFHDKTIEFENDDEVTAVIYDIIQQLNPSLIISFYPGYCVHPDHEATARAVIRALRKFPDEKRPTLHCVAFSNNHEKELGKPHIEVNISEFAEQKKEALYAHLSQTSRFLATMEQKWKDEDPEALTWLQTERFWIYPF